MRRRLADRFILRPTRHPIEAENLRRVELAFSGGRLEVYVARREGDREVVEPDLEGESPELLVVKFPGTAGRAERSTLFPANLVEVESAEVWTWNPPGYGRSSGRPRLDVIAAAAREFFGEVVSRRRGEGTRVWIHGNSLGCATGLSVAAAEPGVDGLVLRNPPPLVELVSARDAWWNLGRGGRWVAKGVPPEMDAVGAAAKVAAPILFIESTADRLVPPDFQAKVRAAHRGKSQVLRLEGAEHHSPIDDTYREELERLLGWLWAEES